jgi:tetratricopeptide (TPR) repeat protein
MLLLTCALWFGNVPAAGPDTLASVHALEEQGKDAEALAEAVKLSVRSPVSAVLHREIGRVALKTGQDLDLADLHLEIARSLAPEDPEAHYLFGLLMEEQHHPKAAVEAFRTALEIRPKDIQARFHLGSACLELGDAVSAQTQFQQVKAAKPEWTAARLQLVDALEKQGLGTEIEQELLSLHQEQPHLTAVTRRLVAFYEGRGRGDLAKRYMDQSQPPPAVRPKRVLPKSRH